MTPTLAGRLQTRIFLALTIGALWTAVITPALPRPGMMGVGFAYRVTFKSLGIMVAAGLLWEVLYHLIQQLRWDKDWPSLFNLLAVIPEAVLLWYLTHWFDVIPGTTSLSSPILSLFIIHVSTTWVLMWLFLQGPLRVVHVRWRFEGGRVLSIAPLRRRPHRVRSLADDTFVDPDDDTGHGLDSGHGAGDHGDDPTAPRGDGPGAHDPGERRDDGSGADDADDADEAGGPGHPSGGGPTGRVTPRVAGTTSGNLVMGIICRNGHFGYPGARHCMVCGLAMTAYQEPALGWRPPLGVLICADGHFVPVDGDLGVVGAAGPEHPRFVRHDGRSATSYDAEIRLVNWQPVVLGCARGIYVSLPDGREKRVVPHVPIPLEPGADLLIGDHRIRYESHYRMS